MTKTSLIATTVILLLASFARADELGYVSGKPVPDAEMGYRGHETPAEASAPVQIDYALETDKKGRLQVWFKDERIHLGRAVVELADGTELQVVSQGDKELSLVLLRKGTLHLVGPGAKVGIEQGPQKIAVTPLYCEFVVDHNAEANVTRVSVLNGVVQIRDLNNDATVILGANQFIEIRGGTPPGASQAMSESQVFQVRAPFDFVGKGRAESQSVVYPALTGSTLPGEDCAPHRGREAEPFKMLADPVTQPPGSLEPARVRIQF
jgi:hypothetical protein